MLLHSHSSSCLLLVFYWSNGRHQAGYCIVLPVFVMAVEALPPAMLHRRLYWEAVIEGIQGGGEQPTALGELVGYYTEQLWNGSWLLH